MQYFVNQNFFNVRVSLPMHLSLPKLGLAQMALDVLKMASVVLIAALAIVVMGL